MMRFNNYKVSQQFIHYYPVEYSDILVGYPVSRFVL